MNFWLCRGSLSDGEKFGVKRNHIARTHSFRKFVTTKMIEAGIKDTISEKCHGIDRLLLMVMVI
jgi:hypothetical protein